ncbi:MAG: hypothetical protein DMF17_11085 [Verrucomicrobia bacterium]|nr:MAG: hypothetical protein DMF17_11085 [Verrucomicrobiota bacterium]
MPRNNELKKILLIGSGPIVIGQGCEFDYSGVQACKALREEGYQVVLVNSNPATIMTDPEFADRTYVEPITAEVIEAIIEREKPDAMLPTMGGQTALNAAMELYRNGALARHRVKLIGANAQAIAKGEDRQLFKEAMLRIGLEVPRSGVARSLVDANRVADEIGTFPLIIRPAFTLGGMGGGIAYNREELDAIAARGLDLSPVNEVLIDESLVGWKEFEMEVMRDRADNCVVVCSIENFDPMGVHTGDSITVAPVQTLTDKEYQMMRDAAFAVIREIGVETGGSNIQFAVHPDNGRMVVIEMNPRVSRSSALASKATGFPIAKIAAKLAVGYTLDEIKNDITRETPACFEPTIDYCVVKVPRFTFEKFPQADPTLTTQMKSVGEAMAIGRTFKEALQKALRSLEIKRFGLCGDGMDKHVDPETLRLKLSIPNAQRIFYLAQAFHDGMSIDEVFELTKIDRWFLRQLQEIVNEAKKLRSDEAFQYWLSTPGGDDPVHPKDPDFPAKRFRELKRLGFSDVQILATAHGDSSADAAESLKWGLEGIRVLRTSCDVVPTYRLVDTCAADFEAYTPYYYSTYGDENDLPRYVSAALELVSERKTGASAARADRPLAGRGKRQAGSLSAITVETAIFRPILIDRFLEDAIEVDVDCISDGEITVIGAVMEHIEEAGIHSGDSACVIPTFSLSKKILDEISSATKAMARELNVRGLMNVQFAVKGEDVYVLEVNPRASRTVPFVSKAIGVPLAKLAAKVMTGKTLRELGFTKEIVPKHFSVKEAVFPFLRYQGTDISLGPEMKSTGEVMGMDADLGLAYAKSQMAAPPPLPKKGNVFVSVKDSDKEAVIPVAREFVKLGFGIISTSGTADALAKAKIKVTKVFKLHEGRPNVLDRIKNGDINFIINTPSGKIPREHEVEIRNAALAAKIPIMTTVRAAQASANGIRSLQKSKVQVRSLQEYHANAL